MKACSGECPFKKPKFGERKSLVFKQVEDAMSSHPALALSVSEFGQNLLCCP